MEVMVAAKGQRTDYVAYIDREETSDRFKE